MFERIHQRLERLRENVRREPKIRVEVYKVFPHSEEYRRRTLLLGFLLLAPLVCIFFMIPYDENLDIASPIEQFKNFTLILAIIIAVILLFIYAVYISPPGFEDLFAEYLEEKDLQELIEELRKSLDLVNREKSSKED